MVRRAVVAGVPTPLRSEQALAFRMIVRRAAHAGYRRFLCEPAYQAMVMEAVSEAWPTGVHSPYRVDTLEPLSSITCLPGESIVVLHIRRLSERGLRVKVGRRLVHLITTDTQLIDQYGRRPLELDDVPYFSSVDLWTPEA